MTDPSPQLRTIKLLCSHYSGQRKPEQWEDDIVQAIADAEAAMKERCAATARRCLKELEAEGDLTIVALGIEAVEAAIRALE